MSCSTDSDETAALLDRIAVGDKAALDALLRLHRPYLKRIVQMRIDAALRTRVDASDVVQEAQVVIAKSINRFIVHRPTSFRIWIRRKLLDQLIDQRRRHLGAEMRSVYREQNLSDVSSIAIARKLLSSTPSKILRRAEFRERVYSLIEQLGENDREVLMLRHADEISNAEVAELLGIDPNTARQRYGRALRRLYLLFAENHISMDASVE